MTFDYLSNQAINLLYKHNYQWLVEIDRIPNDDEEFYTSSLAVEFEFDFKNTLQRIGQIILSPILPQNNAAFIKKFKKFSDKTELALIREDADLWTPLLIVFIFSMVSIYSKICVTSWIIMIWLFGSGLIFVLGRVLGGDFSYNQVLSVIGYCLIPLILTGFVSSFIGRISTFLMHISRLSGVVWATTSSSSFLASIEYKDKKILLAYPIFLLYVYFLHLYTGV